MVAYARIEYTKIFPLPWYNLPFVNTAFTLHSKNKQQK